MNSSVKIVKPIDFHVKDRKNIEDYRLNELKDQQIIKSFNVIILIIDDTLKILQSHLVSRELILSTTMCEIKAWIDKYDSLLYNNSPEY